MQQAHPDEQVTQGAFAPDYRCGRKRIHERGKKRLIALCEQYSFDRDDYEATAALIEKLWWAYGSYCATKDALTQQVGVADELRDLETLLDRARTVLPLVRHGADLTNDDGCLRAAGELTESLHSFPNMIEAQTTLMPERENFMHAKRELQLSLLSVRLWAAHRQQLVANLELVIDVCERVEHPASFTKRSKTARHMFRRELGKIYIELLHPLRLANWMQVREAVDPPPPVSTRAFAHAAMVILGVPFEVKGVSS